MTDSTREEQGGSEAGAGGKVTDIGTERHLGTGSCRPAEAFGLYLDLDN